jgi:hypothetical protein
MSSNTEPTGSTILVKWRKDQICNSFTEHVHSRDASTRDINHFTSLNSRFNLRADGVASRYLDCINDNRSCTTPTTPTTTTTPTTRPLT